jgi:hypothetical protein
VLGAKGTRFFSDSGRESDRIGKGEIALDQPVGNPTSAAVLGDGRLVVTYATPDDPLLGGQVEVAGVVRTQDSVCMVMWRKAILPPQMDAYGLLAHGLSMIVTGSGWHWLRFGPQDLPLWRPRPCRVRNFQ